jgi:hypothetical protein
MEKMRKKTITFTVEQCEYEEILTYARIKGHGGQFPASNFAHYAVFQMMKKYPVNEAEIAKYRKGTKRAKSLHRLHSLTLLWAIKRRCKNEINMGSNCRGVSGEKWI